MATMTMTTTQDLDMNLCTALFGSMKLVNDVDGGKLGSFASSAADTFACDAPQDVCMALGDPTRSSAPSPSGSFSQALRSQSCDDEAAGCAFLRSIRAGLDAYPTTGGAYLDTIFAHREVFAVYPSWHGQQLCARGFSELAWALERRPGRADRDADMEAAVAFRYEAAMIAACS